jgi:hypothetical protein
MDEASWKPGQDTASEPAQALFRSISSLQSTTFFDFEGSSHEPATFT